MISDNKPIFIIGSGRSGTSILTWCLGQHSNILPLPETLWIAKLSAYMATLYKYGTLNGRFNHLGALDWDENDFYGNFGRAIDQFIVETREPRESFILKQLQQNNPNLKIDATSNTQILSKSNFKIRRQNDDPKARWVDGAPSNTHYVSGLEKLFPQAKFIHLLRNPHSVARSLMGFSKSGSAGVDHSEADAYRSWMDWVEAAELAERALGQDRVLRIHYEDLISSSSSTLKQCLEFLQEDYSEDCLLPLKQKINSSSNEAKTTNSTGRHARKAQLLYDSILENPATSPNAEAKAELERKFEKLQGQPG